MKEKNFPVSSHTEVISKLIGNSSKELKNFSQAIEMGQALDRQIYLADVDEDVAEAIDSLIRFWNKVDKENGLAIEDRLPIKLYINSDGGSLKGCFHIIDSIKMSKTPVHTITTGGAYSAGFFIHINGHKRYCYPKASFLYHEGSTGYGGDAGKFRNYTDFYKRLLDSLQVITTSNTKITNEEYEKHRNDDWWFDAKEAVQYGIVDEILEEFI